jgi:hypothetical protein
MRSTDVVVVAAAGAGAVLLLFLCTFGFLNHSKLFQ